MPWLSTSLKIMNQTFKSLILLIFLGILVNCSNSEKNMNGDWKILFDGTSLKGWDTYLGPRFEPGVTWENIRQNPPVGFNVDPVQVFSIVEEDGQKALRISGEIWGGISTKQEFENYHLQLQFKWGQLKWYPRDSTIRDSGLLYHGIGAHGEADPFWLKSQEFQIQEGDVGDYWGVGGAITDITAKLNSDSAYQYDREGSLLTFGEGSEYGRNCKKFPDAEKPSGEWNTLDLYCLGGKSMHVVNGVLTMILQNSRIPNEERQTPLTKGKIQLQSEAAEVFYRNIKTRPISELPKF
jgi:hypothetical protein